MSLEAPQSHKMPQREGKEARREKRKNCNIKLAYPEMHSGKKKKKTELCLPLLLKFSVTDAEENGSKAQIFVG